MKFPNEAFDYIDDKHNVRTWIKRAINWKNSKQLTNLTPWLNAQVAEASINPQILTIIDEAIPRHVSKDNLDFRALLCLRWVIKNFTYKTDDNVWKTPEYWQRYDESLTLMSGDCEDGAILLYVLCRVAGIPANRLHLLAGLVQGGGHCWLAYRPEEMPWLFTFMDWCYWRNTKSIKTRPKFFINERDIDGDDPRYYDIWFGFNECNGYYYYNMS